MWTLCRYQKRKRNFIIDWKRYMVVNLTKTSNVCFVHFLTKLRLRSLTLTAARLLTDMVCKHCASPTAPYLRFTGGFFLLLLLFWIKYRRLERTRLMKPFSDFLFCCLFLSLQNVFGFIHSFILYLPYIQNFTIQGWNNEIKKKVNVEETWKKPRGL